MRYVLLIGLNLEANVVNSRFYTAVLLLFSKKKMLYATTKLLAIIVFICTINITYAFDIKQVLFGNKAAVNDKSTPSFGRPVEERPSSNRAGNAPYIYYSHAYKTLTI
jgi:hypothetical protein